MSWPCVYRQPYPCRNKYLTNTSRLSNAVNTMRRMLSLYLSGSFNNKPRGKKHSHRHHSHQHQDHSSSIDAKNCSVRTDIPTGKNHIKGEETNDDIENTEK